MSLKARTRLIVNVSKSPERQAMASWSPATQHQWSTSDSTVCMRQSLARPSRYTKSRWLSRLVGLTVGQRDHLCLMLSAGPNPRRTLEDWRGTAARGEQCASTLAASGLGAVPQTLGPRRQTLQGCSLFRGSVLWSTGSLELRGLVRDRTRLRPNLETISLGR